MPDHAPPLQPDEDLIVHRRPTLADWFGPALVILGVCAVFVAGMWVTGPPWDPAPVAARPPLVRCVP
jgi:hypothetical protein